MASRVFLCHQNRLLCDCLAAVLTRDGDLECLTVDTADPLNSLLNCCASEGNDVLLLDPGFDSDSQRAVSTARSCREQYPKLKLVLFVSGAAVDGLAEFANVQSHGCILDGTSLQDVRQAIGTVLSGQPYCSPQLAQALLVHLGKTSSKLCNGQTALDSKLTAREQEILHLIQLEKLSNKQIARRLHVSLYTVKNHVHNIIEKLGVEDRHGAVRHVAVQTLTLFQS